MSETDENDAALDRRGFFKTAGAGLAAAGLNVPHSEQATVQAPAGIRILDGPIRVFPGQTFRVALEQAAGSGDLAADVPPTLEMFDHWHKDDIQRFYFRSLTTGDASEIGRAHV